MKRIFGLLIFFSHPHLHVLREEFLFIDGHDFGRTALHISLYKGKMRALSLVRRSESECELVG